MRGATFQIRRSIGDRRFRLTAAALILLFLLIYTFQVFVSAGTGVDTVDSVVGGYLLSFGGRTAYIVSATICAFGAGRLLLSSQNAILYAHGRSPFTIWMSSIVTAVAVSALISFVYIVAQFLLLVLLTEVWSLNFDDPAHIEFACRSFIVLFLWGLIGFGLAYVFRNQAFTLVVILVFGFLVEPIVTGYFNESQVFSNWAGILPGSLNWALSWPGAEGSVQGATSTLNTWQSIAILSVYALVIFSLALLRSFNSGPKTLK